MKICLVGNPNSGKTTLFNLLTGLNQKVGNYSGVTVDKHVGKLKLKNGVAEIIDLPGTNSIYPKSIDESIVLRTLVNTQSDNYPDLVVLVMSATQIRRSLILVSQVIDLGLPVIVAMNMIDEARNNKVNVHSDELAKHLGVPVCLISARRKIGIKDLLKLIDRQSVGAQPIKPNPYEFEHGDEIAKITGDENGYRNLVNLILAEQSTALDAAKRIHLLELRDKLNVAPTTAMGKDINDRFRTTNEFYATLEKGKTEQVTTLTNTQKIDRVLTHKYFGLPIAFFVMYLLFQAIFSFAEYPMAWLEGGFSWLGQLITGIVPDGMVQDLLVNGIVAGLSGVLVFIPQIAILFGLLAILEGTGYLSRISFMLDRVMRKFGLSGKSVVPMMSGFACAIPAVMSTRNIKNTKERLINIMVIPLLSCSARLPVYILLIGMFIPQKKLWGLFNAQGLTMMAFYLAGLILAVLIAGILHRILKVEERPVFVMELPRYRFPQWRNVLLTMYQKAKIFTVEAGKIILFISIILWVLASYGPKQDMQAVNEKYEQLLANDIEQPDELRAYEQEKLVNSYAGHIGKAIEPAIKPLGYDWKIGIALLTSFAAREVFVGTMATIYSVDASEDDPSSLRERLLAEKNPTTGEKVYSFATVFSLLIFFAFAMQCMSTLAIVKRETKSWKWPIIQLVYLTVLAYGLSFIAYQLLIRFAQ